MAHTHVCIRDGNEACVDASTSHLQGEFPSSRVQKRICYRLQSSSLHCSTSLAYSFTARIPLAISYKASIALDSASVCKARGSVPQFSNAAAEVKASVQGISGRIAQR